MMKKILLLIIPLSIMDKVSFACTSCNKPLRDSIYNSTFYPNLILMLSAFFVLAAIVAGLTAAASKHHERKKMASSDRQLLTPVPLTAASMILGIGLGGFADGIIFHQILQWHEMLSNKIPASEYIGKSVNMFWDGIFHFFCLAVVLTGVILLWKISKRTDINKSRNLFIGGLLAGWGLFNLVEGIIDHHVLKLHNVVEVTMNHDIGNYIFLAFSILLIFIGYLFLRSKTAYGYK